MRENLSKAWVNLREQRRISSLKQEPGRLHALRDMLIASLQGPDFNLTLSGIKLPDRGDRAHCIPLCAGAVTEFYGNVLHRGGRSAPFE